MKLLQWNIWYKEKPDNVYKLLKKLNLDIICLQELTKNSVPQKGLNVPEYLAKKLGFSYYFHEAQSWHGKYKRGVIGDGVYTKHKIISKSFSYIQKPKVLPKNYSDEGRVFVEVNIKIGDKVVSVGTTHMSYTHRLITTRAKEKEADNLVNVLKHKKSNFIFTGDLNSAPNSYTVKQVAKYLKHAGPDYTEKSWTTKPFNKDGFHADTLDWRLDYIFATPDIKVNSCKIIKTPYSDHLPLLLDFTLP